MKPHQERAAFYREMNRMRRDDKKLLPAKRQRPVTTGKLRKAWRLLRVRSGA
jgi:hypothetical protein